MPKRVYPRRGKGERRHMGEPKKTFSVELLLIKTHYQELVLQVMDYYTDRKKQILVLEE